MPGSALRLLNQGRAQGLFTPSTTSPLTGGPGAYYQGLMPGFSPQPTGSPAPPANQPSLKRTWTDSEVELGKHTNGDTTSKRATVPLAASPDITMADGSHSATVAPHEGHTNGTDIPSPSKRARTTPPEDERVQQTQVDANAHQTKVEVAPTENEIISVTEPIAVDGKGIPKDKAPRDWSIRLATRPMMTRASDRASYFKDPKRGAIMALICQKDDPDGVMELIKEASGESKDQKENQAQIQVDCNIVIDDLGHTPLHLAASLTRIKTVERLIASGADIYRGNFQGETALIRSTLATHGFDNQNFHDLLEYLNPSLCTIDIAKRSILHHIALSAGVKGRAPIARYYMNDVLSWIVKHEEKEFRPLYDLQDEHGDTTLNIAARVGNRSMVKSMLDVGANRLLANKLGLRPGDFGVESEVCVIIRERQIFQMLLVGVRNQS